MGTRLKILLFSSRCLIPLRVMAHVISNFILGSWHVDTEHSLDRSGGSLFLKTIGAARGEVKSDRPGKTSWRYSSKHLIRAKVN